MTDTSQHTHTAASWGPLMTPPHPDAAGHDEPIWKDNAFVGFWDPRGHVFGSVHVSTSPNAPQSRRARCSLLAVDRRIEIIEDLEAGEFNSRSLSFGLDGVIAVEHPEVSGTLVTAPLLSIADFSTTDAIPPLVHGKPLQHFQQACSVKGWFNIDGQRCEVDGDGFRDRTWGFRDESSQWLEYAGLMAVFDGVFVTAMKFLRADGTTRTDGFVMDATTAHPIVGIAFRRSAAAQFMAATLTLADESVRTITMVVRHTGFSCRWDRKPTDRPSARTTTFWVSTATACPAEASASRAFSTGSVSRCRGGKRMEGERDG